jgi:hypothetical protein
LDEGAKKMLRDGMSAREFETALIENNRCVDAIDFMAHALAAREGIWWECLCMQHSLGAKLSPPNKAAAAQWLMQPTEESRAAAKATVEAGPMSHTGALAMAATLTGGSVHPPELPFNAPPPFAPQGAVTRTNQTRVDKLHAGP